MKIKYKILLQFVFLIVLVSSAIIFTTIELSEDGRQKIFNGVSSKLMELQEISEAELRMAKEVANAGIVDSSGLAAIDQITRTALAGQREFYNTVSEEIDRAGDNIIKTLMAQNLAIDESLDQLLSEATDSLSTTMELDSDSFLVISNAALSNVGYLQSASLEGIKRFKADQEDYILRLADLEDENNFAIDELLIDILEESEHPGQSSFKEIDHLVYISDRLKTSMGARQGDFLREVFLAVDQQKRILSEEVRLAVKNVKWAINQERENSAAVQTRQIETAIEKLLLLQAEIRNRIENSAMAVQITIDHLKNNLPVELQKKGEKNNIIINLETERTRNDIARTQALVGKRIEENTRKAQGVFESAIGESQLVIEESMQSSLQKTAKLSFLIAAGCTLLAVIFAFMMIKSITKPISHVLRFAEKLSKGDLSERLVEGPDEMGEMGKALNRMADELEKLQAATINSFNETLDQVMDCVFMFDPESLRYIYVNQGALDHLGYDRETIYSMCPVDIKPEFTEESFREMINPLKDNHKESLTFVTLHRDKEGKDIPVEILLKYAVPPGNDPRFVTIVRDISERIQQRKEKEKIQAELLHKQKLESVGQLAAGIAHEINTPVQFIGTNIEFFSDTHEDIERFVVELQTASLQWPEEIQNKLADALENLDWEYLAEEIPLAIRQSKDGVDRVSSLVTAMKRFSHPGSKEMSEADLNEIIETALTVSSNEWKYNAEIVKMYDKNLPKIPLLVDQMGQVVLNMIVNASQAIHEKNAQNGTEEKGMITVSTRVVDNEVELIFHDTGIGIPESIIAKVFDPFFTTKEVGKGTGQGLAICHDVITQKHHGSLQVTSNEREGTTFVVKLPITSQSEEVMGQGEGEVT